MRQFLCIFISCFCLALPLCAQSNKMIKELESKRGALQKQIAESETLLNTTKKDVGSQLNGLATLTGQIEERKRYILAINNDMETIDQLSFISRLAALAYVPSYFLSITKRVRCRMISQKINIKAKAEFNF